MVLSLAGVLYAAGPAPAARCEAPPGRAGIEQYCETIPGPGGSRGRDDDGGSGSRGTVPPATRRQLEGRGAAGRAVVDLVRDTGVQEPKADRSDRAKRGGGGGAADGLRGADSQPSDNVLSAVRSAVESGPGTGGGFVWILVLLALFFALTGWHRYRRRDSGI